MVMHCLTPVEFFLKLHTGWGQNGSLTVPGEYLYGTNITGRTGGDLYSIFSPYIFYSLSYLVRMGNNRMKTGNTGADRYQSHRFYALGRTDRLKEIAYDGCWTPGSTNASKPRANVDGMVRYLLSDAIVYDGS
jgi:hypothetical protein